MEIIQMEPVQTKLETDMVDVALLSILFVGFRI